MARATPIIRGKLLHYRQHGQEEMLIVESAGWYRWLDTASVFAFKDPQGSFTARKEQASNRRGGWYWRAYRRRGGILYRAYVGKSEELTLATLHAIASQLAAQEEAEMMPGSMMHPGDHESAQGADVLATHLLPRRPSSTLPTQLTSFIGREQEVAAVSTFLRRDDVRLLTLTGPGGVGKTRLGLQIAAHLEQEFADGVCFVSLAPISETELVVPTIAQALGVKEAGAQPLLARLQDYLREKQMLLFLDNFEQVVSAASILPKLLTTCFQLKMLVTSRAVLHIAGEHQFPILPLPLPGPDDDPGDATFARNEAIALFCLRAQEVTPDFQLTPGNSTAVAELCRRLDGLPLAIELAAARIKLLPPQALLTRLQQHHPIVTSTIRELPARQHTLHQTIKWSYDLLDVDEKTLFRYLCVFVGGCTLEAAEAVCRVLDHQERNVLEDISSLLDKSLLQQREQASGEPRLLLLETIRAFGQECIVESGEAPRVQQTHARYFLHLAEVIEPQLYGAEQVHWFDTLEHEHENMRAALRWFIESGEHECALRLAGALARFWTVRGYVSEGRQWLRRALVSSGQLPLHPRAKALSWAGWLAQLQSDASTAEQLCKESLELSQELFDARGIALAQHRLGLIDAHRGNFAAADALLEESVTRSRDIGDTGGVAYSLMALGNYAVGRSEPQLVRSWLEEALGLFRALDNGEGIAWSLWALARLSLIQGERAQASALAEEALALFGAMGLDEGVGQTLLLLGQVLLQQGETERARLLFEESHHIFKEGEYQRNAAQALVLLTCAAVLQEHTEAARTSWEESLAILQALHDSSGIIAALSTLAGVARQHGEARWAVHLWGAAERLREQHAIAILSAERARPEQSMDHARMQLGAEVFAAAWAKGRQMTPEQAFAMRDVPPARLSPGIADDLSARELEVLRLLAQGLTNAQIAERLVISPRTVNAHLRSIYNKLAVTSRTAATRYALAHQFI
jgi:predicted ATPase/DNA-binding CsgD family transcriptional regulator